MGNEIQHRIRTGCFLSRITSSDWRPASSGKARSKSSTIGSKMRWRPKKNFLGVFFFLIKLAVISTPIFLVLGDVVQEPITNIEPTDSVIQHGFLCSDKGGLMVTMADTVLGLVGGLGRMQNGLLTELNRGREKLVHFGSHLTTVDSILASIMTTMVGWSQSVNMYCLFIHLGEGRAVILVKPDNCRLVENILQVINYTIKDLEIMKAKLSMMCSDNMMISKAGIEENYISLPSVISREERNLNLEEYKPTQTIMRVISLLVAAIRGRLDMVGVSVQFWADCQTKLSIEWTARVCGFEERDRMVAWFQGVVDGVVTEEGKVGISLITEKMGVLELCQATIDNDRGDQDLILHLLVSKQTQLEEGTVLYTSEEERVCVYWQYLPTMDSMWTSIPMTFMTWSQAMNKCCPNTLVNITNGVYCIKLSLIPGRSLSVRVLLPAIHAALCW